jgi:hypothetical protein
MAENPDYILELSGAAGQESPEEQAPPVNDLPSAETAAGEGGAASPLQRKWIGVHFKCCDVYSRIWRNREGTTYAGHCPRCSRKVQAKIGPDGVSARFFTAG